MIRASDIVVACCVGSVLALAAFRTDGARISSRRDRQAVGTGLSLSAARGRAQNELFCGRLLRRAPPITPSGVGPIRLAMTIEEVKRICPEVADTVDDSEDLPAIRIHAFGSIVLVVADAAGLGRTQPATGPVLAIKVVGGRLATAERLGPGSTLRQLRRVYGRPLYVVCEARLLLAHFHSRPGMNFLFGPLTTCPEGRETRNSPVPDSTRVAAVGIYNERQ